MPGDASLLALTARARSEHEIVAAGPDRLDQLDDAARIVGAVAVHEHHDVGFLRRHGRSEAHPAITPPGIDDVRTPRLRPRRRGVATSAGRPADPGSDPP